MFDLYLGRAPLLAVVLLAETSGFVNIKLHSEQSEHEGLVL
jgi:hypothetical protein